MNKKAKKKCQERERRLKLGKLDSTGVLGTWEDLQGELKRGNTGKCSRVGKKIIVKAREQGPARRNAERKRRNDRDKKGGTRTYLKAREF